MNHIELYKFDYCLKYILKHLTECISNDKYYVKKDSDEESEEDSDKESEEDYIDNEYSGDILKKYCDFINSKSKYGYILINPNIILKEATNLYKLFQYMGERIKDVVEVSNLNVYIKLSSKSGIYVNSYDDESRYYNEGIYSTTILKEDNKELYNIIINIREHVKNDIKIAVKEYEYLNIFAKYTKIKDICDDCFYNILTFLGKSVYNFSKSDYLKNKIKTMKRYINIRIGENTYYSIDSGEITISLKDSNYSNICEVKYFIEYFGKDFTYRIIFSLLK